MGISTVSGPFRSKNGFQELVNGEWVSVGSGSIIPITNVDGGTTSVTIPALQIGSSATYITQLTNIYPTTDFVFTPATMSGVDQWTFLGITSVGSGVNTINGEATLSLSGTSSILWQVTFSRGPDAISEGANVGIIYVTAWGYSG